MLLGCLVGSNRNAPFPNGNQSKWVKNLLDIKFVPPLIEDNFKDLKLEFRLSQIFINDHSCLFLPADASSFNGTCESAEVRSVSWAALCVGSDISHPLTRWRAEWLRSDSTWVSRAGRSGSGPACWFHTDTERAACSTAWWWWKGAPGWIFRTFCLISVRRRNLWLISQLLFLCGWSHATLLQMHHALSRRELNCSACHDIRICMSNKCKR